MVKPVSKSKNASSIEQRRSVMVWTSFWLYSAFVFYAAILPASRIPGLFLRVNDKLAHLVQYFLLFLLTVRAFSHAKSFWLHSHAQSWALFWCFGIGIVTELLQFHVPGRSASFTDELANFSGAILALLLYRLAKWMQRGTSGACF